MWETLREETLLNQRDHIGDVRMGGRKNIVGAVPDDREILIAKFSGLDTTHKSTLKCGSFFTVIKMEMENDGLKEEMDFVSRHGC